MKISVITATYNSAGTIADTMRSVVSQTYPDIEHIIVDGASTDSTIAIIESYRPGYTESGKQLRVISGPDRGIFDAMNKGIALATGDIVGILNSDDFLSSTGILAAVAHAFAEDDGAPASEQKNPPPDAVYGDVHYVDPRQTSRVVRRYSSAAFRPWKMRMGFMPAHPSFYCRRELYSTHGNFDLNFRIAADFELMLRMIYIGRINIRYLPLDFVTMRTGGASSAGLASHIRIYREHRMAYHKNRVSSNFLLEGGRYICKIIELIRS